MRFDNGLLKTAQSQTVANMVALNCECKGSRWFAAIEKAITEIKENDSLVYNRKTEVLSFVSRKSGETRIVTEHGCHESCDCGNQTSYHQALYQIISRYCQLEDKAEKITYADGATSEVYKRNQKGNLEKVAEKCNGILIWAKPNPKYDYERLAA